MYEPVNHHKAQAVEQRHFRQQQRSEYRRKKAYGEPDGPRANIRPKAFGVMSQCQFTRAPGWLHDREGPPQVINGGRRKSKTRTIGLRLFGTRRVKATRLRHVWSVRAGSR